MKKTWMALLLLSFAVGCASYQTPIYKMGEYETDRKASSMTNSKEKKGLIIGAKLYAGDKFCLKFFGINLVYDGFVPVLVTLENTPNNNSFQILPKNMTLTLSGTKRIKLGYIHFNKCGYGAEVEKNVETKLLSGIRLTGGKSKNGFVFFDARKYGWGEAKMNKLLKNALLEIPIRKEAMKNKPKNPKNPEKYRGENLTFKVLFE